MNNSRLFASTIKANCRPILKIRFVRGRLLSKFTIFFYTEITEIRRQTKCIVITIEELER
jgi:hypothetical protein